MQAVMTEQLVFKVKGSQKEPYEVVFSRNEKKVKGSCNCVAASIGTHCKHRTNLLLGCITHLVDGAENMSMLAEMVKGSDLEKALNDFIEAEKVYDKEVKAAKKIYEKQIEPAKMEKQFYLDAFSAALRG